MVVRLGSVSLPNRGAVEVEVLRSVKMSISGGRFDSCGGVDSAIALDVGRGAYMIQKEN
jgi:hypothetical protein